MALGKSRVNLVASNSNQLSLAQIKEGLLEKTAGNHKASKGEKYNLAGLAGTDLVTLGPVTPPCAFLYIFIPSVSWESVSINSPLPFGILC